MTKLYKLSNNFELIFESVKNLKAVSIYFVIKTGSGNEHSSEAGLSHFVEHMLFKGSKHYTGNEITNLIENAGGSINAYTSLDETAYFVSIPLNNWEIGFDILFDMAFFPKLNEEDFRIEKKVILEELLQGKDNPYKTLIEETFKLAFKKHPYRNPIIGFKKNIQNFTLEDVKNYYEKYYTPENSFCVIVGDIPENKIIEKISIIEKLPKNKVKKLKSKIIEPVQTKYRFKNIFFPSNLQYLTISYKLPGGYFKLFPEIEVLSSLLGEFETSILKDKLKNKLKIISEISTFIYPAKDYSLFTILAIFPLSTKPNIVLDSIFHELEIIKERQLPYDEIYKAIINLKADKIYNKETVMNIARNLIFYHTFAGDYKAEDSLIKKIEKIKEQDISKVINKYINFKNANIVLLAPKKNFEFKIEKKKQKTLKKNFKKKELIQLSNGIKIIFEKNKRLPLISFKIATFGGLMAETFEKNGISYIMTELLIKNTKHFKNSEIEKKFELFAGSINPFSGRNSCGLEAIVLKEFFEKSWEMFVDSIFYAEFNRDNLIKEKKETIDKINAEKDDLLTQSIQFFYENIFKGTYYSMKLKGSEQSLKNIKVKDVQNLYKNTFHTKNIVFGITGDFNNKIIEEIFSSLENIKLSPNKIQPKKLKILSKHEIYSKKLNKNQSHIIVGLLAPAVKEEEYPYFKILKSILSGPSGKLFIKMREELGLCYSTFAFYMNAICAGALGTYICTSTNLKDLALKKLLNILINLKNSISQSELEKAKNNILGEIDIASQKFSNINSQNVTDILFDLGIDYNLKIKKMIKQIKLKELKEVIDRYFKKDNFIITILE